MFKNAIHKIGSAADRIRLRCKIEDVCEHFLALKNLEDEKTGVRLCEWVTTYGAKLGSVHIFDGIELLADAANCVLLVDPYTYPGKYLVRYFVFRDVAFFQIDEIKPGGDTE